VSFIGKTGADALGDRLGRTFAARRVDARLVRDPQHPTGTSVNLVWTTGRRHFVSSLASSEALRLADIDLSVLPGHDHLLRADPWFSEPMLTAGGNRALFEAARRAGLSVSLDINWDPQLGRVPQPVIVRRRQCLRETLPLVDVAHGNVRELCVFTDAGDLNEALVRLRKWGVGAVVVHMGEQGAGYFDATGLTVEPCVPAVRAVNTTGTGDVLSVCMMLMHNRTELDLRAKLRLANTVVAEYIAGRLDLVPGLAD
jgi:sugar/nucleoside kinase (ribokinase family)